MIINTHECFSSLSNAVAVWETNLSCAYRDYRETSWFLGWKVECVNISEYLSRQGGRLNTCALPGWLPSLTRDKWGITEPNSWYFSHHVDYYSIPPLLPPPILNCWPLDITSDLLPDTALSPTHTAYFKTFFVRGISSSIGECKHFQEIGCYHHPSSDGGRGQRRRGQGWEVKVGRVTESPHMHGVD